MRAPLIAGRPGGQSGRAGANVHVENVGGLHVEGHGWLGVTGGAEDSLRECAEAVTHADEAGNLNDVTGGGRFGRGRLDTNPLESLLQIEEPTRDDAGDDTRSPHTMARRGLGTVAGKGPERHLWRLEGVHRWRRQHLDVGRSGDIEPGQQEFPPRVADCACHSGKPHLGIDELCRVPAERILVDPRHEPMCRRLHDKSPP
jgi:hypothetical protein